MLLLPLPFFLDQTMAMEPRLTVRRASPLSFLPDLPDLLARTACTYSSCSCGKCVSHVVCFLLLLHFTVMSSFWLSFRLLLEFRLVAHPLQETKRLLVPPPLVNSRPASSPMVSRVNRKDNFMCMGMIGRWAAFPTSPRRPCMKF